MAITLWRCMVIERKFGRISRPMKVLCGKILVGHHFRPSDRIFRYTEVNYTGLEEWLGGEPITCEHPKQWNLLVRQAKPRGWKVSLPRLGVTLSPQYDYRGTLSEHNHRFKLDITAFLRMEADEKHAVDWFLDRHWRLRAMLTVLMGDAVYPRSIRVCAKPSGSRRGISCYVFQRVLPKGRREVDYGWMPAPFLRLRNSAKRLIKLWFKRERQVQALADMYLSVFYSPIRLLEPELMLLTQGLERYHRLRFGGGYVREKNYEEIRRVLSSAIPSHLDGDFKEALKSRIKYGYQFSLRKRLTLLDRRLSKPIRRLINLSIGQAVNSRNYYTHYDPELKESAAFSKDLQVLVARLSALSMALILKEIGYPQQLVPTALKRNRFFGFALRQGKHPAL